MTAPAKPSAASPSRPRLVVLGCGFAGYSLVSRLDPRAFDITLVTPRNYFLFTPLLPSAVTGSVEFRSIVEPARWRLHGVRVLEAEAIALDRPARLLTCRSAVSREEFTLTYDQLVIAVGMAVSDHGVPGVQRHALPLYSIEDARAIRRRILECFALAELPGLSEEERRARLTFVVCGGGPTGVEAAAEIHDLIRDEAARVFPESAPLARILLLEAGARLLSSFDAALSDYAAKHFGRAGIEVRTSVPVAEVREDRVVLRDGSEERAGLVLWSAGTRAVPLIERLGLPLDDRGRVRVDSHLRPVGISSGEIYALGDCASAGEPPLPATAQVAQQQGKYVAISLQRQLRSRTVRPFEFRSFGMMAYIGVGEALADLPHVKWGGRGAWFFWRSVYLTKLVSFDNKVKVAFDWLKASLFGRDLSRF